MIDNACGFERMSFMDGFLGYNQIKMYSKDEKHTSFKTPLGSILLHNIPFGLKNAGATSTRHECDLTWAYTPDRRILCWWFRREKPRERRSSRRLEKRARHHAGSQLKMNSTKSFLGVDSDKFLGFVVTFKGIHLDPEKARAIRVMQPPRNLKELRGLRRWLAIWRFISNFSWCCQPFTKLMKKGVSFIWNNACQEAFEEIKEYLTHPPVLVAPVSGKPFLLYVRAMDHSLRTLLTQSNDQNHEQAIYYLSRIMIRAEHVTTQSRRNA